jgi:small subunit ribosomal protein S6
MARKSVAKAAPKTEKSNQYEAMFLFPPPGVTDVEGMTSTARGMIERHGGKIIVIKRWDERKLTYEIGKQKRGTYIIAYFTAPPEAVTPLERDVNLSEDVIRVLVTRADHLNEAEMNAVEPQPIQPREERNPWDKPDFNRPARRDDRGGDRDRDRGPRREEAAPAGAGAGSEGPNKE